MKVVINKCYGGFGLSLEAIKRVLELKGKNVYFYEQTKYKFKDGVDEYSLINDKSSNMHCFPLTKYMGKKFNEFNDDANESYFSAYELERTDPDLIQVIEELGDKANGPFSELKIVKIPDGIKWYIDDYDGLETIEEEHKSWS